MTPYIGLLPFLPHIISSCSKS